MIKTNIDSLHTRYLKMGYIPLLRYLPTKSGPVKYHWVAEAYLIEPATDNPPEFRAIHAAAYAVAPTRENALSQLLEFLVHASPKPTVTLLGTLSA